LSILPPPPPSTLFPYTTLFRSPLEPFVLAAISLVLLSTLFAIFPLDTVPSAESTSHCAVSAATLPRTGRSAAHREETAMRCALRSEEHTSELQSQSNLVCRLLL